MTINTIIACPECKKKFKGREDLQGKKIRCPACNHSFIVKTMAVDKAGSAAARGEAPAGKGSPNPPRPAAGTPPAEAKPAGPQPKSMGKPMWDEDDNDANPYGVTELDIKPRCPHCANPLESEKATICLYCGYNTLTRELGSVKKVIQLTRGDHFMWLLPGILTVVGILFLVNLDLFFCILLPDIVKDSWMDFVDAESMRIWTITITLFLMWGLGMFATKRLILQPVPPEKLKD
jgi:DNA-directed RNA polymerase subunit RPC12/RpoP